MKIKTTGQILENKVIVTDLDFISIYNKPKSYGELKGKKLLLSLYEALYLQEKNKLQVLEKNKELLTDHIFRRGLKVEKRFLSKYMAYADLRDRGYPVRTGLSYGVDFRVYPRGKSMDTTHTQYLVHVLAEDQKFDMQDITRAIRLAHGVKTQLVLAIVDGDSKVRYYKFDWFKP